MEMHMPWSEKQGIAAGLYSRQKMRGNYSLCNEEMRLYVAWEEGEGRSCRQKKAVGVISLSAYFPPCPLRLPFFLLAHALFLSSSCCSLSSCSSTPGKNLPWSIPLPPRHTVHLLGLRSGPNASFATRAAAPRQAAPRQSQ